MFQSFLFVLLALNIDGHELMGPRCQEEGMPSKAKQYETVKVPTIPDCWEQCQSDAKCQAISFISNIGCSKFSSVDLGIDDLALAHTISSECKETCREKHRCYNLEQHEEKQGVSSGSDCQLLCDANPRCSVWTHYVNVCYMQPKVTSGYYRYQATSGIKDCVPTTPEELTPCTMQGYSGQSVGASIPNVNSFDACKNHCVGTDCIMVQWDQTSKHCAIASSFLLSWAPDSVVWVPDCNKDAMKPGVVLEGTLLATQHEGLFHCEYKCRLNSACRGWTSDYHERCRLFSSVSGERKKLGVYAMSGIHIPSSSTEQPGVSSPSDISSIPSDVTSSSSASLMSMAAISALLISAY